MDRTGQSVRRGQALLSIYSPDLVATERELLLAVENARRLKDSPSPQAAADSRSLLAATRQRLRFWDVPDSEIGRVERSGEVSKTLTLDSPVSGVVLKKDALPGMAITRRHAALHDRGSFDGLGPGRLVSIGDGDDRSGERRGCSPRLSCRARRFGDEWTSSTPR